MPSGGLNQGSRGRTGNQREAEQMSRPREGLGLSDVRGTRADKVSQVSTLGSRVRGGVSPNKGDVRTKQASEVGLMSLWLQGETWAEDRAPRAQPWAQHRPEVLGRAAFAPVFDLTQASWLVGLSWLHLWTSGGSVQMEPAEGLV